MRIYNGLLSAGQAKVASTTEICQNYQKQWLLRGQVASSARSVATNLPGSDSFFMLLGQISIYIARTELPLICTEECL